MDAMAGMKGTLTPIRTGKAEGEEKVWKGERQAVSPMARVFHEPNTNVYVIVMVGWNTYVNPDVLKANLIRTLLSQPQPRVSSLQVMNREKGGKIEWVPTTVDVDKHFVTADFDPNTNDIEYSTPEEFVEGYISNLSTTTIDPSKPMWDIHHLNVKTSDAEAVTILRAHHSIGDGTSLMSLLLACTRKASDPQALPEVLVSKKSLAAEWDGVRSLLRLVWNTVAGVFMFLMTAFFLRDTKTPLKGPAGIEFSPRRFVYRTISLDDIKLIKNSMKTTVNDVVVGITQAAFSRYLNRRYGEINSHRIGETVKKINLPKNIRLRAICPINMRPPIGVQSGVVDGMEEKRKDSKWGNKFSYILLPFSLAFQEAPLDYVRQAKAVMDRKKASFETTCTYFISNTLLKFLGSKAAGILFHRMCSHATICFSNVPGPKEEIAFYGYPIAYIAASSYGLPNALKIHVVSYVNKMTFVLSAHEGTIPDPHQLGNDIVDSFNLIKAAALARKASQE